MTSNSITAKPTAYMSSDIATVLPAELKELRQYITWNAGPIKADGKFDKIPCGRDGTGIQWQKQHQWMSFQEALEKANERGHSGIGLVLPAMLPDGYHLVATDFDSVDLEQTVNNPRLDEIRLINERLGSP
jgi:primase-polymerase (primpol)-like protein